MKKEYKNHLIIGNFEDCNFEKLFVENENKEYEGIIWSNGSIDKNGKIKKDLCIEKGDTIYIFYNHLPDRKNRILMKCSVEDNNTFYYDTKEERERAARNELPQKPAIRIKLQNIFCVNKDKDKFSEETLKAEYDINNFQGKQHLKEDNKKQKKLIEELEKISEKNKKYTFEQLVEDMNKISKCSLEKCRGLKDANHQTFERENGMNYYEAHHLIEQCNARKNEKFPKEIIDDKENIINLCSNCHKRIHNGKKEDRRLMVKYLYEKNKEYYDELLLKIDEIKTKEQCLPWLLKQYGI